MGAGKAGAGKSGWSVVAGAAAGALFGAGLAAAPAQAEEWSIVIHGGAGVIERGAMSRETEAEYRLSLAGALQAGSEALAAGKSALEAVELVIRRLEDDPLFNAGKGAVFTAEGTNELDASIMDGRTRAAGAVAGLTRVKHPISAARAVMERSPHVLLSGEGAERFAEAQGLELVEPDYFFTERRWNALIKELAAEGQPIPQRPANAPKNNRADTLDVERKFGTVGVVARDARGDLAAGTSTGGTTAKRWGRVGDSPVIGAGTYAQNGVCAVSATGSGEYFIRAAVAKSICARIELKGETAQEAADAVVQRELKALGGDGGVIALGPRGEMAWSYNTTGMYRARQSAGGEPVVAIYKDER